MLKYPDLKIDNEMKDNFLTFWQNAESLSDIFEVVKTAVTETIGRSRAGLMLGLADLGNNPNGFFGAFHPVGDNIIVMNKTPLRRIRETQPDLYKPYAFHILLHEYLHSLGYIDEQQVRRMTYEITESALGKNHLATQIAADTARFIPHLSYPDVAWQPQDLDIELVRDFDRSSVSYIC